MKPLLHALILLFAFVHVVVPATDANVVGINIGEPCPPVYVGDLITVPVYLETNIDPVSFVGVFIEYDSTKLRFEPNQLNAAEFDNLLLTGYPYSYEENFIAFTGGSNKPLQNQSVLMATLDFVVLSSNPSTISVSLESPRETSVTDANFNSLPLIANILEIAPLEIAPFELSLFPQRQKGFEGEQVSLRVDAFAYIEPTRSPFPVGQDLFIHYDPEYLEFTGGMVGTPTDLRGDFLFYLALTSGSRKPEVVAPGVIRATLFLDQSLIQQSPEFLAINPPANNSFSKNIPPAKKLIPPLPCSPFNVIPSPAVIEGAARLFFNVKKKGVTTVQYLRNYPHESSIYVDVNAERIPKNTFSSATIVMEGEETTKLGIVDLVKFTNAGEIVTFSVLASPNEQQPLRGITSFLEYDTELLEFVGGTLSDQFDNTLLNIPPREVATGILSFSTFATADVQSNANVATLSFRALRPGNATFSLLDTAPYKTVAFEQIILLDGEGGQFTSIAELPTTVESNPLQIREPGFVELSMFPLQDNYTVLGTAKNYEVYLRPQNNDELDSLNDSSRIITGYIRFDPTEHIFAGGTVNTVTFEQSTFNDFPAEIEPGVIIFSAETENPSIGTVLVATVTLIPIKEGFSEVSILTAPPLQTTVETTRFTRIPYTTKSSRMIVRGAPPVPVSLTHTGWVGEEAEFVLAFTEPVFHVPTTSFSIESPRTNFSVLKVEGDGYTSKTLTGINGDPLALLTSAEEPDWQSPEFSLEDAFNATVYDLNVTFQYTGEAPPGVTLTHIPSGKSTLLIPNTKFGCDLSGRLIEIDDEANRSFVEPCPDPELTTYRSREALSTFDGLNAAGPWKFTAEFPAELFEGMITEPVQINSLTLTAQLGASSTRRILVNPGNGTGDILLKFNRSLPEVVFDQQGTPIFTGVSADPLAVEERFAFDGWLFQ